MDAMDHFFRMYRKRASSILCDGPDKESFRRLFYRPAAYFALSSFDLAFLSLVDDHLFGVQVFSSSHPFFFDEASSLPKEVVDVMARGFNHHVVLGPAPRWGIDDPARSYAERKIVTLAGETFIHPEFERYKDGRADFLRQRAAAEARVGQKPKAEGAPSEPKLPLKLLGKLPPLLGICQVEVNTGFLVGGGRNLLRCLTEAIDICWRTEFRDLEPRQPIRVIVLESYAWHELTVLVFSNSFARILEFIMRVRELTLSDIGRLLMSPRPGKNVQEWEHYYSNLQHVDYPGVLCRDTSPGAPASSNRRQKDPR
jgi:hypothetical protein